MLTALYRADCVLLTIAILLLLRPPLLLLHHHYLLSLSLLPLSLPSIPLLLLLLFRTPASFFHHCAGHTISPLLSPNYFTTYFPLPFFFIHPSSLLSSAHCTAS